MEDVKDLLREGYPRLALAKALGIPFAPYLLNLRGTFDVLSSPTIESAGSDTKIPQDTIIDAFTSRVTVDRVPANIFQTMSDYFLNWQSGIEVMIAVVGSPHYLVTPKYTPLANVSQLMPRFWVLTQNQNITASFNARIALAEFPTTVVCTLHGRTPVNDEIAGMSNEAARSKLAGLGFTTGK